MAKANVRIVNGTPSGNVNPTVAAAIVAPVSVTALTGTLLGKTELVGLYRLVDGRLAVVYSAVEAPYMTNLNPDGTVKDGKHSNPTWRCTSSGNGFAVVTAGIERYSIEGRIVRSAAVDTAAKAEAAIEKKLTRLFEGAEPAALQAVLARNGIQLIKAGA